MSLKISKVFLVTLLALALSLGCGIIAYAQPVDQYSNQYDAVKSYNIIEEKYNGNYPDNYAGSYIDDQGDLTVCVTGDNFDNIKDIVKNSKVKYQTKKSFSLNYLNKTIDKISKDMTTLDVSAVELDEKNNKIYVYVNNLNNEKEEKIKELVNSPAIEIKNQDLNVVFTTNVVNGTQATGSYGSFSIGFGAISNSTGQYGFVVPGHLLESVGSTVSYQGSALGNISQKYLGGSADGAFVPRNSSSWTLCNYFYNGDYIQDTLSNIPQGGYLEKYGAATNKTSGTVTSTNYTATINGITLTNMYKASYVSLGGDSGGSVTYWANNQRYLSGTHSASALDANGNWVYGQSFSIFSKLSNVCNALNVEVRLQ